MIKIRFWGCAGLYLLASLAISSSIRIAEASESVVLRYSIFQQSLSVSELSTLARTGELSSSLRAYLERANRSSDELRQVLTQEIPVDPILLSQILNSSPGEFLLDGVSQVIRTPSGTASRQSLRAALVGSALSDGEIQLIEVLENYPTQEVYVDGDRLDQIYNQINQVVGSLFF